jgi:hypothetical protein
MMKYTVTLTKVLEAWWGIDEFLSDLGEESVAKQDAAIIDELLLEDIQGVLDDASWTITREEGEEE